MELLDSVEGLAEKDDTHALDEACFALIACLPQEPKQVDQGRAQSVLKSLRSFRRFEQLKRVANGLLLDGSEDPIVVHHLAQGMIELGELHPAISILEQALKRSNLSQSQWAELKAAVGRAWKDLAVQSRLSRPELCKRATMHAFKSYRDVWHRSNQDFVYQGVNMLAIAHWDDGRTLDQEQQSEAEDAANKIIETINSKHPQDRSNWDIATAGEASLGARKHGDAVGFYGTYIQQEESAFALAGSLRQLQQLWRIEEQEEDWASELVAALVGKLGQLPGASFSLSADAMQRLAEVPEGRYQALLGGQAAKSHHWLQQGLEAARSVAIILRNQAPHGSGFVVRGGDLDPSLGDELMVMTNAHVVSDPVEPNAATRQQAIVQFELLRDTEAFQSHSVKKVIWQSPTDQHDVALLRVSPPIPESIKALTLHDELPELAEHEQDQERIYIIGHPNGRTISFSFQDNKLLDYELDVYRDPTSKAPCRIHYRTPTEPGSSGSPVFDVNWRIVGIHHAGGHYVSKLNKKPYTYKANEGLWIETIRRALQEELVSR